MEPDPTNGLSDDELADLAQLVDGTLPADRRAEVEARVAASPQLASIVERQGAALDSLRSTDAIGAPVRLRSQLERRRGMRRSVPRGFGGRVVAGAAAAAALVVLVLVLALPGALSGGPSVTAVAELADKPPTQAAPGAVPGTPQLLRENVDDVSFPNYAAKFGWKPVGAREDTPSDRGATTIYYQNGRRRIAYTIVSGDALDTPSDARSTVRGGVEYRTFRGNGRTVVTWKRDGHTCVLSSKVARPAELLALADWRGKGAISF